MQPAFQATPLKDWLSITIHWMFLFGAAWGLANFGSLNSALALVLLLAALTNILAMSLLVFQQRLPYQSYLLLFADTLFAQALFFLSGGLAGPLGWAGLLPLATGAIYFQVRGGLAAGFSNLIIQSGLIWLLESSAAAAASAVPLALFYGSLALVLGLLSLRLSRLEDERQRQQKEYQQELQHTEQDHRRSIYKMVSALSATLNYQRVLETALDISAGGWGQDQDHLLVSAVLLYASDETGATRMRVGSARRFTPADMRTTLAGTTGVIGRAIDEGQAQLASVLDADPELSRFVSLRACRAAYLIPLRSGLDTYGVLLFAHPDDQFFSADRREYLDLIANQAKIALQNARLYRDLELEKERMAAIQEDTRKKLARDLHDGPTQSVAAIAMRVNLARRLMDRDPKATEEELFRIEDLARKTTKEIRHMLFTLRPLVLESQGLVPALEAMAEKVKETYDQEVLVQADPQLAERLELGKQGVVFAIAEEAVNNARKHAKAAHIWVRIKPAGTDLALLEVQDDGVGFDPAGVKSSYESRGSLGMVNMRERAELVSGYLQVDSQPGEGTRVSLVIPLSSEAADRIQRGL